MVNKYVLMVINVFSKYGWAEPLKTKQNSAVTSEFKKIFKDNHPKRLWIMGRNFTIRQWKIFLYIPPIMMKRLVWLNAGIIFNL